MNELKIKIQKHKQVYATVELRQPTIGDMIQAERIAGKVEGIAYFKALLAAIGEFDGRKVVSEELDKMPLQDFLAISQAFMSEGLQDLGEQLSSSVAKEA